MKLLNIGCGQKSEIVAPHGGAWIEIECEKLNILEKALSPLTEGRGLKLRPALHQRGREYVAPHGGAWIEMPSACWSGTRTASPLTEGRGLKYSSEMLQIALLCRPSRRGVD